MLSFLPEAVPNGAAMKNENFSFSRLSFLLVIIYVSLFKIGKNGLLSRIGKFKRVANMVNKYPGANFYPFLGSTPEMIHLVFEPCRDILPYLRKMVQSCGPIFRFWVFHQPKLVVTCSETAIASLQQDLFPGRSTEVQVAGKAAGGEGLIVINFDIHGPRKKIWKQWFTRRIINENLEIFQKEAIRLSQVLSKEINKEFDLLDHALHCTFRTIANSAFGEEYVDLIPEDDAKQHFHGLTTFAINLFSRVFRPWLASDFIYYNFTSAGRETRRCIENGHKLTRDAIEHGKMLRKNKLGRMDSNHNTPCFLDHLLDVQEQGDLTEDEVFQELNDFLIAGYDTTGLTLCWTLYLLSLNPECQTKIVDELEEIFNGNMKNFGSEVTPKHLQNMKYLELCMKESLRIYPAVAVLFRRSTGDKEVVMPDGKIVPSGVDMYVPLRITHKDPKYFPEPEKFIPERHLVSKPAWLPFGLGCRNCIGQVYAMQELKMILAYLLMEYQWETLEKPGLEPLMTPMSYPENGLRFKISKR